MTLAAVVLVVLVQLAANLAVLYLVWREAGRREAGAMVMREQARDLLDRAMKVYVAMNDLARRSNPPDGVGLP